MRILRAVEVDADTDEVFALVSDVVRYPEFFHGMTRWEPIGDQLEGVGARFKVLMQVGSVQAGGVIVVDRWDDGHVIAWSWERGVHQQGEWRLEPHGDRTLLTLVLEYHLAGPFAWLAERLAARIVTRNIDATLQGARRIVEDERGVS